MEEKILSGNKRGMTVLLLTILLYAVAIAALVFSVQEEMVALMVVCIVYLSLGWLVLTGLKVLGPQEALVLTLFGNYTGTLKGEGFYFVNPFSVAVNPAAKTQLNQSGDVDTGKNVSMLAALSGASSLTKEMVSKKVSLKIMTLSNTRQKINDCLGNPVEIGIAVTWRVVDTAKAVFDVDNYKEFLSLQCDSALRNIVRLYPPATATRTRAACGAPATWSPPASGTRSRTRWRRPVWRSWKPGSPTWPTPRRSPPPCSSVSRPRPSSTPER